MFIEILFKILLLKRGVLIYAEHCRFSRQTVKSLVSLEDIGHKYITIVQ